MHETPEDLERLQELLDRSYQAAGSHLTSITTPGRRIAAAELPDLLTGVQILALATTTREGHPRVAPVDGLFFRGDFYFGSSKTSMRYRHLLARPHVSAAHVRGEELSVVVHGTAEIFSYSDNEPFRDYCYEVYIPRYGESWKEFAADPDIFCARIRPERMFTFRMDQPAPPD